VKIRIISGKILSVALLVSNTILVSGQEGKSLNLENAVDLALQNNHLLNVRKLQVEEKKQKVNEDRVKYLPVIGLGGTYQYNTNLPVLTIEQGRFGQLPLGGVMIPLPSKNEVFELGNHNVYNAGVTFYQPITQLGKINAGVKYSRTEMQIAKTEETKAMLQIRQAVEKLYFGLLIVQKQIEEAELKVELAAMKLHDAENALSAGKTIESGIYGLSAGMADEQQNLLRLRIQADDYAADLIQLTGLQPEERIVVEPVAPENLKQNIASLDTTIINAGETNNDLRIASLTRTKADFSVRASKFSYLPDLGIQGGYTYQEGTDIYPKNNTYIGAVLKWNLNDAFANRMIQKQRTFLRQQAEENLLNIREQVAKDIAKAYRRMKQSEELIVVAEKAAEYRRKDLKVQEDRRKAGLNLESDLLAAKASLAKSEADLYAAQLNYRLVLTELKILTGNY
jgi:outer membrane protein